MKASGPMSEMASFRTPPPKAMASPCRPLELGQGSASGRPPRGGSPAPSLRKRKRLADCGGAGRSAAAIAYTILRQADLVVEARKARRESASVDE